MQKLPAPLYNPLNLMVVSGILMILAYQFADKSIVVWANAHHTQHYTGMIWFTYLSKGLVYLAFLLYPLLLARFFYYKPTTHDSTLWALANSIAITEFMKNIFKWLFGRAWPATWINHNPSLLHDGVYGFHWLQGAQTYGSFPSGHVAVMVAAMTILGGAYPRWRWLAGVFSMGMLVAQVVLYYHFLSDAIAGATLGYLVAHHVMCLSKAKT